MSQEFLLEAEDVCQIHKRRKVLNEVSLCVRSGELVVLLGRNGAGKTSLLQTIIGITSPQSGQIRFRGEDVTRMPVYKRARIGMGFLPHERSVMKRLTVEENLLAILEETVPGRIDRRRRAQQMLTDHGLSQLSGEKAGTLSGAACRHLEICRLMLSDPSLLVLDEPFSGVDPIAVGELHGCIRSFLSRGVGILLTDHNVRESFSICDRAYIIDQGRILKHGRPDDPPRRA